MRKFWSVINTRGGVEDIRLEANNTKKNPRPRTGMLEAKDQGHKRKCSPGDFQKKKGLQNNFSGVHQKKTVFQKIFQALHKLLTTQKIVLSSSRGQGNFRGLEASRPRPRTSKCVLEDVLETKDIHEDSTSDKYTDFAKIKCKCSWCSWSWQSKYHWTMGNFGKFNEHFCSIGRKLFKKINGSDLLITVLNWKIFCFHLCITSYHTRKNLAPH